MRSATTLVLTAALLAAVTGCAGGGTTGPAKAGHGGGKSAVAAASVTPTGSTVGPSPSAGPSDTGTPALPSPTASSGSGDGLTWWSDHQTTVSAVSDDLGAMASDADSSTSLDADCTKLGKDEQAAEKLPPMPDTQAQTHWAAALKDVKQGLQNCHGDIAGNPQQEEGVLSDMGSALTEMSSALERISAAT